MDHVDGVDIVRATIPKIETRGRVPLTFASQFGPAGRRTCWWVTFKCPHGCGSHFGRSRTRFTSGPRTASCGRRVWLKIARTYLAPARAAAES